MGEKDDNGWLGITWAIIEGHKEIVKIILEHTIKYSTKTMEILNDQDHVEKKNEPNDTLFDIPLQDVFKKPINPITFGKYTSLHWAAYKGNRIISSLLLKNGEKRPVDMTLEIDMYGNTALHQAAASNNLDVNLLYKT